MVPLLNNLNYSMSRRIDSEKRLICNNVSTDEWKIRNYLYRNDIYGSDTEMHHLIINSFISASGYEVETLLWKERLKIIHDNFGKFAMYAQNNWKHEKRR